MRFTIERIYYGWFEVLFQIGDNKVSITASDAWDHDSPKLLLETLFELLSGKSIERYIVWDEEPGEYFIHFSGKDNIVKMVIAFSEDDEDKYGNVFKGEAKGDLPYDELKNSFTQWQEILLIENIDVNLLSKNIYESFIKCDIENYEKNWMPYPKEILDKIRIAIK